VVSVARFSVMRAWRAVRSSQGRRSGEGVWVVIGGLLELGCRWDAALPQRAGWGSEGRQGLRVVHPGGITSVTAAGGLSHSGGWAGFLARAATRCADPSGGPPTLQPGETVITQSLGDRDGTVTITAAHLTSTHGPPTDHDGSCEPCGPAATGCHSGTLKR
jgi:hypothetical protein